MTDPYIPPSAVVRDDWQERPSEPASIWRWLAVIPAAFMGFFAAVALGLVIWRSLDAFCPAAENFEGFCSAPWYDEAITLALCVCAGVAAFLVVTLSAWTAPAHRRTVSWLAYAIGAAITISFGLGSSLQSIGPPACALVAGLAGVWLVKRLARPAYSQQAVSR